MGGRMPSVRVAGSPRNTHTIKHEGFVRYAAVTVECPLTKSFRLEDAFAANNRSPPLVLFASVADSCTDLSFQFSTSVQSVLIGSAKFLSPKVSFSCPR